MDTRSATLPLHIEKCLAEYTFRDSVCEIVRINDLNDTYTHGAKDAVYEKLEEIINNLKK